jgi:hypothetical protein
MSAVFCGSITFDVSALAHKLAASSFSLTAVGPGPASLLSSLSVPYTEVSSADNVAHAAVLVAGLAETAGAVDVGTPALVRYVLAASAIAKS